MKTCENCGSETESLKKVKWLGKVCKHCYELVIESVSEKLDEQEARDGVSSR